MRTFLAFACLTLAPGCTFITEGNGTATNGLTTSDATSDATSGATTGATTTGATTGATTTGGATCEGCCGALDCTGTTTGATTGATTDASTGTTTDGGPCFPSKEWCYQEGTDDQWTRCESVDGAKCINPEIRYGTTEGGVPAKNPGNNYDQWCNQLGYSVMLAVEFGPRDCVGGVNWCEGYDEPGPHWCDWKDGHWKSATLDSPEVCKPESVTTIVCE